MHLACWPFVPTPLAPNWKEKTNMNKFLTGTLALGLLLTTAACGSDDKSSDTTTAGTTVDSTVNTTADSTADTTTADASDAGTLQAQVLAQTITALTTSGAEFDEACVTEQITQLSDDDAQLILDAGAEGTPTVSPAGEAIGAELLNCVTQPTATS